MKKARINLIQIATLLSIFTIGAQSNITTEDIMLMNDSVQLPGTLSFNKTLKQQPLTIFVHGSGNVDRNGNQKGLNVNANYIKLLSEALNNNGIALYRYDKRTSNMANMKFLMQGITFDDFIEDAKIAINNFKDDTRFSSITLIGHSQGSLVAMLAATVGTDKYISLAGPGTAIDRTMIAQIRKQSGDSLANIVTSHFKELKSNGKIENVDPNLFAIFNPQNQLFFKSWILYDPSEEISKLQIPVLIINGAKDVQVKVEDAKMLHDANPNSELRIIENMNHVLKTITRDEDNLKSYSDPKFPLSEDLVFAITEFIKK